MYLRVEEIVEKENLKLKGSLIIQSFGPLFLLLFIKYYDSELLILTRKFVYRLIKGNIGVVLTSIKHEQFLTWLIVLGCILGCLASIISVWQFKDYQTSGYINNGEKIQITEKITDSGVIFFMTFVIPLVLDDLGEKKDFSVFLIMFLMIIRLMWNTNLFYQNPVLTLWNYKVFKFRFVNTDNVQLKDREFIGISKGRVDTGKIIQRCYISDDVFVIRNKIK